jgi:hypothetical protein
MKKVFTLLLLLLTFSSYAQKAKLELKLKKDSTYYLTMNVKMDIDQFIQGTHQMVKTTITGKTAYKVVAIQDTLYTMDVTYKNLAMDMDVAGKTLSFNSEGDTTNFLNKAMGSMVGNPFNIVMSKRGRIIEVKNIDNLFSGLFKAFPHANEQQTTQLLAQLKQSFGEKTIKGNLQETFVVFPQKTVGVGGTWSNSTFIESAGFSTHTKTSYTLSNITNDAYEITGTATVMPDKEPAFKSTNKFFMRLTDVDGNNSTSLKIDKKTGWVSNSHITKHIKANVELKQAINGPLMMTYPMVIDGVLAVTGK